MHFLPALVPQLRACERRCLACLHNHITFLRLRRQHAQHAQYRSGCEECRKSAGVYSRLTILARVFQSLQGIRFIKENTLWLLRVAATAAAAAAAALLLLVVCFGEREVGDVGWNGNDGGRGFWSVMDVVRYRHDTYLP